jgi:SAM-dependent methyltransferase
MPDPTIARVTDDAHDFYGREYWLSYQEKAWGYADITVRARTDLPERCLYWLRAFLKYRLPPGRVLELGSGHGGFVALLRWAGFDAVGLELSPWVVDFARRTFDVPMLLGPVEDQALATGSLDGIVLMDVLEHLPDPVGTIQHCLRLLKPDGIFLIQTPRYPEGKTYPEMVEQKDPFLEQLKPKEHLYLFSMTSIQTFFRRLGVEDIRFEPPIFAHYDMFLVASRSPIRSHTAEAIEQALSRTPTGRMVLALWDLYARYMDVEADRAARLEVIQRQAALIQDLQDRWKGAEILLQRALTLRSSRLYYVARRVGRWRWVERLLQDIEALLASNHPKGEGVPSGDGDHGGDSRGEGSSH